MLLGQNTSSRVQRRITAKPTIDIFQEAVRISGPLLYTLLHLTITIILLYEDYLEAEALDALVKLPECPVKSDNYYWIMNIDEMEMLLSLYAENQVLFTEVIREKITREINQSPDGKSLRKILSEKGIVENNHVAVPRISRYREDVINNARLHLGHDESRR